MDTTVNHQTNKCIQKCKGYSSYKTVTYITYWWKSHSTGWVCVPIGESSYKLIHGDCTKDHYVPQEE